MKVTAEKNEKVAKMIFASIYPLYLNRLVKNGRTKEELNQVITSQQQQITRLEMAMGVMKSQIQTMQSAQSEGEQVEPPPPHY